MNSSKINEYIVTLNLVLMLVGFELATSLLMPIVGGFEAESTQIVTIPYRAFALGISLLSIFIGLRQYTKAPRFNAYTTIFVIFIIFYTLRILYDNANGIAPADYTSKTSKHYFFILIPYLFSMMLTYENINYKKAAYWIIILGFISMLFSFGFAKEDITDGDRMNGNLALNTISYGHMGVSIFLVSIFTFFRLRPNIIIKILLFFVMALAFYTAIRAGSRGPIVCLVVSNILYFASKSKHIFIAIFPSVIILALIFIFREEIIELTKAISPVAGNRMAGLVLGGDSSGRDVLYAEALSAVAEHPITGVGYMTPGGGYPHNIILDGCIAFGILGGVFMVFILSTANILSFKGLAFKLENAWIGLLVCQQSTGHMFSGGFYGGYKLVGLITLSFLIFKNIKERIMWQAPIDFRDFPPHHPMHPHNIHHPMHPLYREID